MTIDKQTTESEYIVNFIGGESYMILKASPISEQPFNISFHDGSKLTFNPCGKSTFTGNADEAATLFFECVIEQYDHTRKALLEKLESDKQTLRRLAVILAGNDSPGEIMALTVTAQSFVDRCKALVVERDELRKILSAAQGDECTS